jgi:DeoR/GlpR family transcriptional regulator of sugar metabolism
MGQMAKPPKKGEKEWRVYASQEKLAAVCGVDVDTVRRAWNRLEVVGLLKKDKGTGVPGITSQFSIFGLGFPERTSPQR